MTVARSRRACEIVLVIACFYVVWSVRATCLYAIDESIASDALRTVYASAVKLVLWGVPAFAFAYWVRRSPPLQYLGLSVMPSVRQWMLYLAVIALYLGAGIGFETITGRKDLSLSGISLSITIPGLLLALVSPLLEEILFRGLILQELASLLPRWGANLLAALLFAGIHLPFWVSQRGWSGAVLADVGGVLLLGLLAGWLYLKSTSLWPAYLAHVANNLVAGLLVVRGGS